MQNVILTDSEIIKDWNFKNIIEAETGESWQVLTADCARFFGGGVNKLRRYFRLIKFPIKFFFKRKKYKKVLAWQQFLGLMLAFWCRFFKVRKAPKIDIMTFIYKPKTGFKGKLFRKFMNYTVTSKYVDKIIVFSEEEVEYYSKVFSAAGSKFIFTHYGIEDVADKFSDISVRENYYVSAGRSNRDYDFLVSAWQSLGYDLEIICDTYKGVETERVKINSNCHNDEYRKKLKECYAVVVSLKEQNFSAGQLVILNAFMFSKPIIITSSNCVTDYVDNGINGLIIDKTEKALLEALNSIQNKEYYNKISTNARQTFISRFTVDIMAKNIAKIIME